MTDNVIPLSAAGGWRTSTPAICPCGSHWFNLPVCITDGRVTGHAERPECRECGREGLPVSVYFPSEDDHA